MTIAILEGAVPINSNSERLRNMLLYNKRRIGELLRLMARVKMLCYQLSMSHSASVSTARHRPTLHAVVS